MTKTARERFGGGIVFPPRLLVPQIENDLTRRDILIGAGLIVLAPSCGSGEEAGDGEVSGDTRIIRSRYGSATIEGQPRRVVALDTRSADNALALGVVPLGMSQASSEEEVLPWAEAALGEDETPQLLQIEGGGEIPIERVAALSPDLILAVNSFDLNEDNFETLSQIAPVVHFAEDPLTETWQQGMQRIGRALGRPDRARLLVEEAEQALAAVRERTPAFEGKTVDLFNAYPGGVAVINNPSDYAILFPTSISRVPTEKADKYANRLCNHFAHRVHAVWNLPEGFAEFWDKGTCCMRTTSKELILAIDSPDEEDLVEVKDIVGSHLEQFGKRDDLMIDWRREDELR